MYTYDIYIYTHNFYIFYKICYNTSCTSLTWMCKQGESRRFGQFWAADLATIVVSLESLPRTLSSQMILKGFHGWKHRANSTSWRTAILRSAICQESLPNWKRPLPLSGEGKVCQWLPQLPAFWLPQEFGPICSCVMKMNHQSWRVKIPNES